MSSAPARKKGAINAVLQQSENSIDLDAWARSYVAALLGAEREGSQIAGVVSPIAEAS